jgi:hypothetical protein
MIEAETDGNVKLGRLLIKFAAREVDGQWTLGSEETMKFDVDLDIAE